MSLQRIKTELYQELDALFALAATDELAGDMKSYRARLETIGRVAESLGMETEITEISMNLKPDEQNNTEKL